MIPPLPMAESGQMAALLKCIKTSSLLPDQNNLINVLQMQLLVQYYNTTKHCFYGTSI